MSKLSALPLFVCGTLVLGAPACRAQSDPGNVTIEVGECVELVSALERYDCYERLAQAALAAPDHRSGNRASATGADPAESEPPVRTAQPSRPTAQAAESSEVVSAIAKLGERRPNEHVITLENGQIWRQTVTRRYPLRIGQEVRIYPTRWGDSYRLSALDRNGFIQVERIE